MFGKKWTSCTGTVLGSRVTSASVSEHSGSTVNRAFMVAVVLPDGQTKKVEVKQGNYADFWAPRIGQVVAVEVELKSGSVRFDKSDLGLSFTEHERIEQQKYNNS